MTEKLTLHVNNTDYELDIDPDTPLLWVLRDHLKLNGAKYSCGIGVCGACTVHMDGRPVRSCATTVKNMPGKQITTIEGLTGPLADALHAAWQSEDVPQCGYCQTGQIMEAAVLLRENPNPTDDDIDKVMSSVLCRCGTYLAIRRAIHRAAEGI
jgi:isoquinoline 1-oxidoreductase alpha subunit